MTSTHDRGKKALNKFSHLFKKHEQPSIDSHRERAQSLPKNEDTTMALKHRDFASLPQTTTGFATHSKAFAFDDDNDPNIMSSSMPYDMHKNNGNSKLGSPRSFHATQTSINLEQNPLASSTQPSHTNVASNALSIMSIEDLIQDIDSEKVQINLEDEDDEERKNDGSFSYSDQILQDDS